MRVQIFPTDKLKIEPWLVNGWQSYGMFNEHAGPRHADPVAADRRDLSILGNQYCRHRHARQPGAHAHPHRRQHPGEVLRPAARASSSKAAFSLTVDAGCENGGGVSAASAARRRRRRSTSSASCPTTASGSHNDQFGLTLGGGAITNPGRYLVLLPPINGATARLGHAVLHGEPRRPFKAWDASITFDYMPEPVRHVPARVQPPRRQRAVLRRARRRDAARRQPAARPGRRSPAGRPTCARPRTGSTGAAGQALTLAG